MEKVDHREYRNYIYYFKTIQAHQITTNHENTTQIYPLLKIYNENVIGKRIDNNYNSDNIYINF